MSTLTALPTSEALSSSTLHANPALIREGMGVTMQSRAMRRPYTVIAVHRNGRELVIQHDKTVVTGEKSYADDGERHFEPDPKGRVETITLRRDGTFIEKGVEKQWYTTRYHVGFRADWTDYSV